MIVLHAYAPLSVEGRARLVRRRKTRPIAHVAAETEISRVYASKWVNRWKRYGHVGLLDRSSAPRRQPTATPAEVIEETETLLREHKWSASRIPRSPQLPELQGVAGISRTSRKPRGTVVRRQLSGSLRRRA